MSLTPPAFPVEDRTFMDFYSSIIFAFILEPDLYSTYKVEEVKDQNGVVTKPARVIQGFTNASFDDQNFNIGTCYTNGCVPCSRYYIHNYVNFHNNANIVLSDYVHGVTMEDPYGTDPIVEENHLTHELTNIHITTDTVKLTNMGITYINQYLINNISQSPDHDSSALAKHRRHLYYIEEIVGSIILHNFTEASEPIETISHLIYRLYPYYLCKENGVGGDSWYVFRGHGKTWVRTTNRFTWLVSESMLTMFRSVNKIIKYIRAHYEAYVRRYQHPYDLKWRVCLGSCDITKPIFNNRTIDDFIDDEGNVASDLLPGDSNDDLQLKRYIRVLKPCKSTEQIRKVVSIILKDEPLRSLFPDNKLTFEKFATTLSNFIKICANKSAMVKSSLEACYIDRTPRFEFTTNVSKLPGLRSALAFGDFIVVVDQNDKMDIKTLLPEHYCLSNNDIVYPTDGSWTHPTVVEIINWLRQCFAVVNVDQTTAESRPKYDLVATDSIVMFLLRSWARCLNRSTLNRRIIMMMGPPRGGKSQVQSLHEKTFGSHCNVISPDTIGTKVDLTAPNPALVDALSGVVIWMTEAEGKTFNIELLKQITGGDTIRPRGLYEAGSQVVFRGIIMMTANGNPRLKYSKALADRFLMVRCDSQWVIDPKEVPESPEEQLNQRTFLEDRNFNDRLDKYAPYFLWMMIDLYQQYNNNPLVIPESINLSTKQMWNEVDTYCYFQLCVLDPTPFKSTVRVEITIPEDNPPYQPKGDEHLVTMEKLYEYFCLFLIRWAPNYKVESFQVFESKIVRLPFMKPNYKHGTKLGWINVFSIRKDQLADDPFDGNSRRTF